MDPRLPMAAVAFLTLTLAGCSGGPDASGPVELKPNEKGEYVIHLRTGALFAPAQAKVPLNATVVWVSDDPAAHDVTSEDGSFSSDLPPPAGLGRKMGEGDSFPHTFTKAGTYAYHCKIHHPSMAGTLTVG